MLLFSLISNTKVEPDRDRLHPKMAGLQKAIDYNGMELFENKDAFVDLFRGGDGKWQFRAVPLSGNLVNDKRCKYPER